MYVHYNYIYERCLKCLIRWISCSCNLRTDNIWFWDALHQVSHVFHPFLAFFCCLCGKKLITTCADDLKLVQPLNLGPPFCFNLLNM